MINIKNLNTNKIKINEKSYKNIFLYFLGYVTPNGIYLLYLITNRINGNTEQSNGNKYLTLFSAGESKDTKKL